MSKYSLGYLMAAQEATVHAPLEYVEYWKSFA